MTAAKSDSMGKQDTGLGILQKRDSTPDTEHMLTYTSEVVLEHII